MNFGDDNFDKILPDYLVSSDKDRLREALKQFIPANRGNEIDYNNFYKYYSHDYFKQSDLIKEIRFAEWNDSTSSFEKGYTDAILVSNTCDVSIGNKRDLNFKQCLFAPLIELEKYIDELKSLGYESGRIDNFYKSIKAQLKTNLFYLPKAGSNNTECIALLDNIFWFPTKELNDYTAQIEENRIASLSLYGLYLFILKLSFHLCRLPESCDREAQV